MNTKSVITAIALGSMSMFMQSCATAAQVAQLDSNQAVLSKKVDDFDAKYKEVLSENKMLKEKLDGNIPLTQSTSGGVLFEVMDCKRIGNQVQIEVVLTNKLEEDFKSSFYKRDITVTDGFGNVLKVVSVNSDDRNYPYTQMLYSKTPYKLVLIADNLKQNATSISLVGFDIMKNETNNQVFRAALKNFPIK